jgi:hypothetical protein
VCFSAVPKLRTVLWGWRGTRFEPDEIEGLERIREALAGPDAAPLTDLLSEREVEATRRRVDRLLSTGRFPLPSANWPSIPWPPY